MEMLNDNIRKIENQQNDAQIEAKIVDKEYERIPGQIRSNKKNDQKHNTNKGYSMSESLNTLFKENKDDNFSKIHFIDTNNNRSKDTDIKKIPDIKDVAIFTHDNLKSNNIRDSRLMMSLHESMNPKELSINLSNLTDNVSQQLQDEKIFPFSNSRPLNLNNSIFQDVNDPELTHKKSEQVESIHLAKLILPTFKIDINNNFKSNKIKSIDLTKSIKNPETYFNKFNYKLLSEERNFQYSRRNTENKNRQLLIPNKKLELKTIQEIYFKEPEYKNSFKKLLLDCHTSPFKFFIRLNNSLEKFIENKCINLSKNFTDPFKSDTLSKIDSQTIKEISTNSEKNQKNPTMLAMNFSNEYNFNISTNYSRWKLRTGNNLKNNAFIIPNKMSNNPFLFSNRILNALKSNKIESDIQKNQDSSYLNHMKKLCPILENELNQSMNQTSLNNSLLIDNSIQEKTKSKKRN